MQRSLRLLTGTASKFQAIMHKLAPAGAIVAPSQHWRCSDHTLREDEIARAAEPSTAAAIACGRATYRSETLKGFATSETISRKPGNCGAPRKGGAVKDLAGAQRRVDVGATDDRSVESAHEFDGFDTDQRSAEGPAELDGVVGLSLQAGSVQAPDGHPGQSAQVYVCAPDGPSGSWAMGFEEDVRLLARAFAAGGIDRCRELIDDLPARSSPRSKSHKQKQRKVDVRIALHGPDLDSSDEEELRDLICALVEKRVDGVVVRP